MMVLTATGVVDEVGLQSYAVNPVSRVLLDPGWTNGLKHLYAVLPCSLPRKNE